MATATRTTTRNIPIEARDPRVDAYIAKAPAFARPILSHLREVVHAACPEVEETIRWSMPFFDHRGPLCNMAAFKAHCAFGFWRGREVPGLPKGLGEDGMGNLGRIASLDDVPPRRVLTSLIKAASKVNETDTRPLRARTVSKGAAAMPDDLAAALAVDAEAARHFDGFSPAAKREYIEWIVEAKREATRASRIAQTVEWSAAGRTRNWKYRK